MRKICVVCTSRASWGRIKSIVEEMCKHKDLILQIILAASFYNAEIGYDIDCRVQCLINSDDNESMALTSAVLLGRIANVFSMIEPNMVLVHGDRYEVLAVATAARLMNIPLAHTEGGEKSGSIDDKIRQCITCLASIHFPVTEFAGNNIERIIGSKNNVYVVGSPALDLIKTANLTRNRKLPYVVILQHPETIVRESIEPLIRALHSIKLHKVWVNPNVDAGNKSMLKEIHKQNVEFVKDLSPDEYLRLLKNCVFAIGNSSSFIKEGSALGVPAIIVGNRQVGREHADNITFTENNLIKITEGIKQCMIRHRPEPCNMFGDGTASKKIVKILREVTI